MTFLKHEVGAWAALPGVMTVAHCGTQIFLAFCSIKLFLDSGECMVDQLIKRDLSHDVCDGHFKNSFMMRSPFTVSCMVLLTWIQFMYNIMAFETVGFTVLPAVMAMLSKESLRFMIYMFLGVFMAFHVYYSLPLDAGGFETGGALNIGWVSFLRMYRLCILGDFDFWELEGVDPTLSGRVNATGYLVNAQLDEDESDFVPLLHRDLRLLACMLSFLLCVVMMNMYIGVLGHKYDDFKQNVNLLYDQIQSGWVFRYLLRRKFFHKLCCKDTGRDDHDRDNDDSDEELDSDPDEQRLVRRRNTVAKIDLLRRVAREENVPDWYIEEAIPKIKNCSGLWIVVPDNTGRRETRDPVAALSDDVDDLKKSMATLIEHFELKKAGRSRAATRQR